MQQHFWDECTKKSCHSHGAMTTGLSKVMYAGARTRSILEYITTLPWVKVSGCESWDVACQAARVIGGG
jgi:hypothetical protein